jgi:diphthamide biosynthesis methyltransferase
VETGSDEILAGADKADVAFLVVGDPFGYVLYTIHKHLLLYTVIKIYSRKY